MSQIKENICENIHVNQLIFLQEHVQILILNCFISANNSGSINMWMNSIFFISMSVCD